MRPSFTFQCFTPFVCLYGLLILFSCVYPIAAQTSTIANDHTFTESEKNAATLPLQEVRNFVEVLEKIKQEYVEDVSDQTLIENAIKGMLSNLDPHSAFFNQEEFKELTESTTGEFAGLGLEVSNEDGLLRVISPIDDSPASKADIKAGDLIIRIDETAVQSVSIDEAAKLLRGDIGSEVTLTIIREMLAQPLKIKLTREIIKNKSVRAEMLDNGFGYIRISQFQENTAQDTIIALKLLLNQARINQNNDKKTAKSALKNVKTPHNELAETKQHFPLKGLILDLRNNPGGLVNQAIEIADIFLDRGMIVYIQGRSEESRENFHAKKGDLLENIPMVVLINAGSASAAEIVAGALQDNRRALVAGERSFGKGSVQIIIPLHDGRGIKFTNGRYYTPSGHSIQAKGIIPDVEIGILEVKKPSIDVDDLREANLSNHLSNKMPAAPTQNKTSLHLAESDYVLYEALNLLKTIEKSTSLLQRSPQNTLPDLNTEL